jgi:methylmalonyl-CoA/ethylmalonyl-CoA epimerase
VTIDHVGVIVRSIPDAVSYYTRTFGLRPCGDAVVDPLQDVELQFLEDDRGMRLELIRPLGDGSPAAQALAKGGGLNHVCYRVADLQASIDALLADKAKLVREPRPAVAFNGRRVAFLYTRHLELIEFVEL